MEGKILKQVKLQNDLTVTMIDRSKKLIGDRYQVILHAEMKIPIRQEIIQSDEHLGSCMTELQRLFGDHVLFSQKREKTFVDEKDKESLLRTMIESFMNDMIPYLSRPDFPVRFINKKYTDKLNERKRIPSL